MDSQPVLGNKVKQADLDAASKLIDKEETILGLFCGQPYRQGKLGNPGYLVITKIRVIFHDKGFFGVRQSTDAFRYSEISSVDASLGFVLGDIILNIKGAKETFGSMSKPDTGTASKMIRDLVDDLHKGSTSQKVNSIPEQIKKLAELRDAGILTDAEFQNKKTELLARM
jgi:hypothetical protein